MRIVVLGALLFVNVVIWTFAFPERTLSVSFLDVGQGDAIFIESPTGAQLLIDGGQGPAVLRGLGNEMDFFDRTLDAVVATHPDADHIGGLVDVLDRYDVGMVIESGVVHETSVTRALEERVETEDSRRVLARAGMRLLLGGGSYADILFPNRDVSDIESNAGSIIMRVVYGETEFMLTGDSPKNIERYLVSLYESRLESDVLKVGHHGSKTSSDEVFVRTVNPQYAVISAGVDNRYGHPHQEVLDVFTKNSIELLSTTKGNVTFVSDGVAFTVE